MERHATAKAVRRRRALEAIEDERSRESLLRDQLAELIAEADGPGLDQEAFATMEPDEVALVREALGDIDPDDDELETFDLELALEEEEEESLEDEISRLRGEIELCRRRIRALEKYIAAVDALPADQAQSV